MTEIERLREALEKIAEYCEAEHSIGAGGPQTNAIVNVLLGRVGRDIRAALAATPPIAEREEWKPIESAPKDTTQGDFLISNWNSRGDCCWVLVVRNPRDHHGMSIASHWMPLDGLAPLPGAENGEGEK